MQQSAPVELFDEPLRDMADALAPLETPRCAPSAAM
jgi:hypothetical protein